MNSRSVDRFWHNSRSEPERVFLVGVEFLSRNLTSRDKRPRSSDARATDIDDVPAAHPRQQPPGKVPASARAARSVADPQLHAADADSRSFAAEESMAEFRELALSAGASIAGELHQRRQRPDSATLIGSGKVEELNGAVASVAPDLVIFDHELTPSQQRNLERALHIRVIDRTQLILDIFARHARTREGQLQVELAQLEYMLPRLAGRGVEMSQLGGGIGTRGPGETQLETDRRKIYRRVRHVKEQLENVRRIRGQQRQRRESVPVPVVALVGYTNAGKSTLFNALTRAGVLESPRMFATLDPTLRHIKLPSKREILLSDTVGFIRHLPHTLVSAFRATLEEVQRATLLLQVADVTSPAADEQHAQVEEVLRELEANDKPRLVVMNKLDLLPELKRESLIDSDDVVHVSAAKGIGMDRLLQRIDELIEQDPVRQVRLRVPQSEGKALSTLDAKAIVLSREYREGYVELEVQAPESILRNLKTFIRN
ncbi:MAG TPA: GTPase HflX [Candidatus Limnocylindrales bacterium]|nr:GTPase HflX [Candidatus Limnocylindrales bacterium]